MKTVNLAFCIVFLSFLISCGKGGFEGKYEAGGGVHEFNFKSDGYVVQSMMGEETAEYKYEKNGDEIKIIINEKTAQIYTLGDDGELSGPGGVTLTPVK